MGQEAVVSSNHSPEILASVNQKNNLPELSLLAFIRFWMERVLAALMLLVLVPLLIVLAFMIKLDSPGPVLFHQNRVGKNGTLFTLYKLRTMYGDSETILATYLASHPETEDEWQIYAKLKGNDPRITGCGRWISKFSLNELPQLINVVKGDMSLVGPRPYLPAELPELSEYTDIILSVRPGITGLWQVSGRNEIPMADRVRMEAWYVHNHSWLLDMHILVKTIPVVVSHRGAY